MIVQEVTRTFAVSKVRVVGAMTGAELNAYVRDPRSSVNGTETRYWELWTVDATGTVGDGGDDTFGLCSIIPNGRTIKNTTRGTFTMVGVARFYPTALTPAALGFARNAVASAGGLYSRTTDPTAVLPAAAAGSVTHRVVVTWDSTEAASRPGPYAPRRAYDPYSAVAETLT